MHGVFPQELTRICDVLRENPKGMAVRDIADAIGMNRNTASRYLDMLRVAGQVEMKTYGKAKVFYISQRMPISAMMDCAVDMVFVVDSTLTVVEANDTICTFLGGCRDEILGHPMRESPLGAFDHPLIVGRIGDAMEGKSSTDELRYMRVDGEIFFRVKTIPTVLNSGLPGVAVVMEDITGQKVAEEALRESELKFRTLVEDVSDAIWIIGDDWTFSYVSPRTEEILGYLPERMEEKSLFSFIPETGRAATREAIAASRDSPRRGAVVSLSMRHADGHPVEVEVSASPRYDLLGSFTGYRMVCRDVSERRVQEQRLLQWKSFLFSIVQNIPAKVLVTNVDDRSLVFANRSFEEMFGVSSDTVVGKQCTDIFTPDLCRVLLCRDEEILQSGIEVDVPEVVTDVPGIGERVLWIKKIPIFSDKGDLRYILGIYRDVTDTVRNEQRIRAERDQAQQSLDAAGALIAVVAPDGTIRTMNRRGSEMLGYPADGLIGRNWFDTVVPPHSREVLRRRFFAVLQNGSFPAVSESGHLLSADGRLVAVAWQNAMLPGEDGTPAGVVTSAQPLPDGV
ncbi:PAS domain S-box protein [Methanogenium organophilum]|uniref:PAS domain S-box protein n=1 Tax=Methanogenium organophilum TaxID=2199 RepID=A0A9X9S5U9_METOG|nr:PAS domain S-box protein [Methanogenium organophilum]WAI02509.1 PAS domain S-box protein [Methanogenium organophilum]